MDHFGALVGWSHHEDGDRILLRLESAQSSTALTEKNLDLSRLLMTKQQALVLGHYLMRISGGAAQSSQRGWWRKLRDSLRL